MATIKSLSHQIVCALSRKPASRCKENESAAEPVRRVRRIRYLAAFIACVTVFVIYGQLFGGQGIPKNRPPIIADFAGISGITLWTFQGQVVDENPVGLVVTFGGILDGHQTTVRDEDGYFWYGVPFPGNGNVTAHTIDREEQSSNFAVWAVW